MFHTHWSFDRYWIYKMYLREYECEKTNVQYIESPLLTVIRPVLNMLPDATETCSGERKTSSECLPSSIKWSDTPKGRISMAGNHEMKGVYNKSILLLYPTTANYRVPNVIVRQQFIRGVCKVMRLLTQFCIWGTLTLWYNFVFNVPHFTIILPCSAPPTSQKYRGGYFLIPCVRFWWQLVSLHSWSQISAIMAHVKLLKMTINH